MSCRITAALVAGVLAASCNFDGGSAVTPRAGSDGGGVEDASAPDAAAADAAVDAMPVCTDDDGDDFWAGGPSCAEVLDCNDADADAYPGQTDFFVKPMAGGSFDYNCDGLEEVALNQEGGDCRFQGLSCRGDGWLDGVPGCGERGTYSECGVVALSCIEVDTEAVTQSCR